ncbi:MAG: YafY family protein [Micromonosporaceae bacterium]|jgi:proteasome accessory factor C
MSRRRSSGTTSTGWLARLLNLVPYLLARPGIRIADAAADLGVTEQQLRDDLELLWVCGLPGYGPGDLIDMAFDGDRVTITYDAGINRPLRLTPDEALALVVALRMLAATPGVADRAPIERALAKIEKAVGEPPPVAVRLPADSGRLAEVREAVANGRALEITYYSATRDRTTVRVVDPMRVVMVGGHGYLEAWCRNAGAVRRFRVDRIDAMRVLDEPAAPPPHAQPLPIGEDGVFQPTEQLPLVTLRIGRGARWITEYYPCERIEETGQGWLVSLRVSDLEWARRMVLGLGPDAVVLAPAELARQVRAHAAAALEAYATPTGLAPPPPGEG